MAKKSQYSRWREISVLQLWRGDLCVEVRNDHDERNGFDSVEYWCYRKGYGTIRFLFGVPKNLAGPDDIETAFEWAEKEIFE